MIDGSWQTVAPKSSTKITGVSKKSLLIVGADVMKLSKTPLLDIHGVIPLPKFRFEVICKPYLPDKEQFKKIFDNLRVGLWAYEIAQLIALKPSNLLQLLTEGNYCALIALTDEFHFFVNSIEYFVELGRWIIYFEKIDMGVFGSAINHAIESYNGMIMLRDKACKPQDLATLYPKLPDGCLQIIKQVIEGESSLAAMQSGVLELLGEFLPTQDLPPLGMIKKQQLKMIHSETHQSAHGAPLRGKDASGSREDSSNVVYDTEKDFEGFNFEDLPYGH
jgi:hypothetical protein